MNSLIQSIFVEPRLTNRTEGVYISKVDLFFKAKGTTGGIRLYIKPMENGIVFNTILPYSEVVVKTQDIALHNKGSTATSFEFDAPVFLQLGKEYAICVDPENGSPDFYAYTYRLGNKDLATNKVSNRSFNLGNLYLASGQSAALPTTNEELKIKIYIADFDEFTQTPEVVFHNDNYEFFEGSSIQGIFETGETIIKYSNTESTDVTVSSKRLTAQLNDLIDTIDAYLDGDKTVDGLGNDIATYYDVTGSNTVVSADVTLLTKYYLGTKAFSDLDDDFVRYVRENFIILDDPNFNKNYVYGNTTTFSSSFVVGDIITVIDVNDDVQENTITEIANDTVMIVRDSWRLTDNTSNTGILSGLSYYTNPTVTAKIESYNSITGTITGNESNATNSTHLFANGDTIIGTTSQANATINVINRDISFLQLINNRVEPPETSVSATITTNAGGANSKTISYTFGDNSYMKEPVSVKSKSNEIRDDNGNKSFTATFALKTGNDYTAPQLLQTPVTLATYKNIVQSTTTGETGINGDATSKIVTKTSSLPVNIVAEDIKFFIDAYRPANTSIDVYAKVLGPYDSEELIDKDWTLLSYTADSQYKRSSSIDIFDIREFALVFPSTPPNNDAQGAGTVETGNTTIVIANTSQFSNGDVIMINDANDNDYFVTTVVDNTGSGEIVVANQLTYAQDGEKRIRIVSQPKAAFKYSKNSGIVRYLDSNYVPVDGYNTYAFKIVLRADDHYQVPRVDNYRAITTTV
jgi:hypothetical protein